MLSHHQGINYESCHVKILGESNRVSIKEMYEHMENQFGFMSRQSTIKVIHLMRQMTDITKGKRIKDLQMIIVEQEKTYDKVPNFLLW